MVSRVDLDWSQTNQAFHVVSVISSTGINATKEH